MLTILLLLFPRLVTALPNVIQPTYQSSMLIAYASPITKQALPATIVPKKVNYASKTLTPVLAQLLKSGGVSESEMDAAHFIIMAEGAYNPCIRNGGAVDCTYATKGGRKSYGVCQALPGKKMASAGADWATNAVTQIKWCNSYAQQRYGGWKQAKSFWLMHRWW